MGFVLPVVFQGIVPQIKDLQPPKNPQRLGESLYIRESIMSKGKTIQVPQRLHLGLVNLGDSIMEEREILKKVEISQIFYFLNEIEGKVQRPQILQFIEVLYFGDIVIIQLESLQRLQSSESVDLIDSFIGKAEAIHP